MPIANQYDRLPMINITRGFAVMGIALMNIIAFSMPESAYVNPNAWGGESMADRVAWLASFVLVDSKMRGLFSLLFGASMILLMDRTEMAGGNGVKRNLIRCLWLLIFGLVHYLLLWWGDILCLYAVVGPIAMLIAGRQPMQLVKIAFLAFALHFGILGLKMLDIHLALGAAQAESASAHAIAAGQRLLEGIGQPGASGIMEEIAVYRGDWAGMIAHKASNIWGWGITGLLYMSLDTLGFMLLGMAMLKGGFLSGKWSQEQYIGTARHCFIIGLPPMLVLGIWAWGTSFDAVTTFAVVFAWSFPFRIPLTVGYAALMMAIICKGAPTSLLRRVEAAGRMSLSNYLLTSLLMTALFYGWGLGLFATIPRAQVYLFVLPLWTMMLVWSPLWLARFRQGPLEGLWRRLTSALSQ